MIPLVLASALAAPQPHLIGQNVIQLGNGARIHLTTSFSADLDANGQRINRAAIELEATPPPGDRTEPPPDPDHLQITGEFAGGPSSIDPCWMPAMFLLATGYATADQVERALGFTGRITHLRAFNAPPDPELVMRVLGLLVAQANALRPERATALARLVEAAFPPTEFPPGPCMPEPRLVETPR